ncbi:MAG: phosphoenolpyruvate synthase, partial [Sphingobacteriales bacterium]
MKNSSSYLLDFQEIDQTNRPRVGGKCANLSELSRIEGVQVPDGFCVTTEAFTESVGKSDALNDLLNQLAGLKAENRKAISETSARIRQVIEATAIPEAIEMTIVRHLEQSGERDAYAVRSSATAEDLPTASFA